MNGRLLLILLATLITGCSSNLKPFTGGTTVVPSTEGESRLWYGSEKFEQALKDSNHLHSDAELQAYLQGIMDTLYPEFQGRTRVYVLKAPVLNAFALPNGGIYFNLGLLAALENEAQVATVLAHEGIHFTHKHSAKRREMRISASGAAIAVSMLGIPLLGDVVALSAMSGYSQEHEREADMLGYQRLKAAGYNVNESTKAFQALAREAKANKQDSPFFFASHPKLEQRIKSFSQFNADSSKGGVKGFETYQQQISDLRINVIQEKLYAGQFEAVISHFDYARDRSIFRSQDLYFLAEAYRLRNREGDLDKAEQIYNQVIESNPDIADSYRALGLIELKKKRLDRAKALLTRYLQLKPAAEDKSFIEYYLQQIENQSKPG